MTGRKDKLRLINFQPFVFSSDLSGKMPKTSFFWTSVIGSSPTSTGNHFPAGVRAPGFVNLRQSIGRDCAEKAAARHDHGLRQVQGRTPAGDGRRPPPSTPSQASAKPSRIASTRRRQEAQHKTTTAQGFLPGFPWRRSFMKTRNFHPVVKDAVITMR